LKVLITEKKGQLGKDLMKSAPKGIELFPFGRDELDITSETAISEQLNEIQPEYIINTAAFTAVDKAEKETEQAIAVNSTGAGNLALAAREHSAKFLQVSTDFVFDGNQTTPYLPDAPINPLSIYGKTKANGEILVRKHFAAGSIILRTSWVYSTTGRNFVKTMLNFMRERQEIKVVIDQVGSPTWSKNLALTIWAMVTNNVHVGIYHWSDAGVASWYDFAVAIYEEATTLGLLSNPVKISPIPTAQFQTPAKRPAYSVLDSSQTNKIWGLLQEHWRTALRKMLIEQK